MATLNGDDQMEDLDMDPDDLFTPQYHRLKDNWRPAEMKATGKGTLLSSTFVLANAVVGAGVLALPYAMKKTGLLLGVICLVGTAAIVGHSQHFVVLGCCLHEPRSYEELIKSLFGRRWGFLMEAIVFIYQVLVCCRVSTVVLHYSPW